MPKSIDVEKIAAARQEYLSGDASLAAVALKYGISKRVIERVAASEKWSATRRARLAAPSVRQLAAAKIDAQQILEDAITYLAEQLPHAEVKSAESAAMALVRLIELRRQIAPQTPAEIADLVIELGIPPAEFVAELKRAWNMQKGI